MAYEAVTHGDLVPLCRDLPETTTPAPTRRAAPAPAPVPAPADHRGLFARQPAALKVLWTIWLVAVSVNVVVWVLVSATTAHLQYPWPLWVARPVRRGTARHLRRHRPVPPGPRARRSPVPAPRPVLIPGRGFP